MKVSKHTISLIATVFFLLIIIILSRIIFDDIVGELLTVFSAIFAGVAIFYQLRKDYQLSKASFIYSLNETFSNNQDIGYIYQKLKRCRDLEGIEFTEDDGRRMGDYVMYFEIMGYLLEEELVSMDLVDSIFSNKFFIFTNNPSAQEYQLKYSMINRPILELYCKWFNYRKKNCKPELYSKYSLSEYQGYFIKNKDGYISLNPEKMEVGYECKNITQPS